MEDRTLRAFLEPDFAWDTCPHCTRLREEKKQITRAHARNLWTVIERHVLADPIADKPMAEIRRADILDLRGRVLAASGVSMVNRTVAAVKIAYREAIYREELERNPSDGVGNIQYEAARPGAFSAAELRLLFPAEPPGPWPSLRAYACFLLAVTTGMRKGEVLALHWRALDFEVRSVSVEEVWKGIDGLGLPKWGRKRVEPLAEIAIRALQALHEDVVRGAPEDLVFCHDDGARLHDTWWRNAFSSALEAVNADLVEADSPPIDVAGRRLRPHSLRHTANTVARDRGVDPAKIRAALGWTNESTQEGYTHFEVGHLRSLSEAMDEVLG